MPLKYFAGSVLGHINLRNSVAVHPFFPIEFLVCLPGQRM